MNAIAEATATTTNTADVLLIEADIELEALFTTADFDRFTRDPHGYSDSTGMTP